MLSGTFVAAALGQPAAAETLFHRAENQVPVAIVEIKRHAEFTEIHLQAQAALTKVCFATGGPNRPYLLAAGRNYFYVGGDNVTTCPERRDYAQGDIMVLRFEPLAAGSSTFFVRVGSGRRKAIDRCHLSDNTLLEFPAGKAELKAAGPHVTR
jgi:hypothetical protein